jgi:hypothetical protein
VSDNVEQSAGADAPGRAFTLEIFLVSFAALLLEISYTRIISFKLFYYYTYLVIGLALLGIGSGGVIVAVSKRLQRASTEAVMMWSLLLGAASVGVGYIVIARTSIETLAIWDYGTRASFENLARLMLVCLALYATFLAAGVIIATLFGRKTEQIGKLYFADLVGAGLACAVVVSLLSWIGPPDTIVLAGLILAFAGLRLALRRHRRALVVAVIVAGTLATFVIAPGLLPEQRTDAAKENLVGVDTIFSSWSPLFRVDVVGSLQGDRRLLIHDGLLGSAIYEFHGDLSKLKAFDTDVRKLPFATIGTPPGKVLIIGAAGGHEVLSSLYFDAGHIDAVELNPVTYDLVTNVMADYTGHLAENPKVNYVKGDGRSYLARSDKKYDLVWFPAPDSYSANAAAAGAFVLSESYLYTSETIVSSLEHLSPNGILATQFGEIDYDKKPNRTSRYVATARKALDDLGVHDPSHHILVATTPLEGDVGDLSTVLVKRKPFSRADVARFLAAVPTVPGSRLQYAPGHPVKGSTVTDIATLSDVKLDGWFDNYPYDVRPISDNGPFFWHFKPFDDVIANIDTPIDTHDPEDTVGERVLLLMLGVATLFALVFLLLPFIAIRQTWVALPRKARSALYFATLGFGFIFFEITLIQRLTLFLGYPTYSLTVTLMSLLLFTGIGALLSSRFKTAPARVLPWLLGAIVALTAFYLFALPPLTDELLSAPLALRIPIAFAVLAPLGLCLGLFMPLGLGAVADLGTEHSREYVAWGWAVNGFASVVGAVLSTILAMTFGFNVVLVIALVLYLVALATLRSLLAPSRAVVAGAS